MHLLFALAIFLVLEVRAPGEQYVTAQLQLAYVLGGVVARVATFLALQGVLYLGARFIWPRERIASSTATRLNYLTLALLVLLLAAGRHA